MRRDFRTSAVAAWREVTRAAVALSLLLISDVGHAASNAARHDPMAVIRNDDGSLKYGPGYAAESYNWSGYALANYATGQTYTSASASWTVPTVAYKTPSDTCYPISGWGFSTTVSCYAHDIGAEFSSAWVGIGGTCQNAACTLLDRTLIQVGTGHHVADDGSSIYYAWYELLPANETRIGTRVPCGTRTCLALNPVRPGDAMTASLQCLSNCSPGAQQTWLITIADTTQNWTFSTTVTYASSLASAEWIQEAPSSVDGILPLANFGVVTFQPSANGAAPQITNSGFGSIGLSAIVMINKYGQTSVPSPATPGGTFSACWGDNRVSFAPCPAP